MAERNFIKEGGLKGILKVIMNPISIKAKAMIPPAILSKNFVKITDTLPKKPPLPGKKISIIAKKERTRIKAPNSEKRLNSYFLFKSIIRPIKTKIDIKR